MSVRLLNIPAPTESPADQFKRLGVPTRVDVLTAADNVWVPYAASLLYRARAFLKANRQHLFVRRYIIGDVKIFIRIGPGSEYIQIRAGAPANFYVIPVVFRISTEDTTTGDPTFLNSALTKATAVEIDLDTPSMFPHRAQDGKLYAGASNDDERGYMSGTSLITGGNDKRINNAGVFRHTYIEGGEPKVEFLHGIATPVVDPTPSNSDGLWYQTAALGDQLVRFVDLPIDRRPAFHVSMFASKDGRRIVAEEQFPPGLSPDPGYDDWFILRSIVDVDLDSDPAVVASDFSNLNGYDASLFEALGTGVIVTHGEFTTAPDSGSETTLGEHVYPISTVLDINNDLIHSTVTLTAEGDQTFLDIGPPDGDYSYHNQVVARIDAGEISVEVPLDTTFRESNDADQDPPDAAHLYMANMGILYSDRALPAVIYAVVDTDGPGHEEPATESRRKIVARIGPHEHVVLDETFSGGASVIRPNFTYRGRNVVIADYDIDITLPDSDFPNRYFRGNRLLGISQLTGVSAQVLLDSNVEFAAHSKNIYIGSIGTRPYNVGSPLPREFFTFSHDDVALKKTIVNHVLEPAEPIEGAALDDYKIWFTVIRAI